MAAWGKGRPRTLMAAGPHRSDGAWIYGDLAVPRASLKQHRRDADRRGTTYWRQVVTVSAAAQRERAGDRTAAQRLAWRELVLEGRRHAEWLVSRAKALGTELARIQGDPSHPDCVACYLRVERLRGRREEYLAEIAQLPGSTPTYEAYRHRKETVAAEGDGWLHRQLASLGRGR